MSRAGSFALVTIPESIDNLIGARNGGRVIAEATRDGVHNVASAALASAALQGNTQAIAGVATSRTGTEATTTSFKNSIGLQQLGKFGGVFTYVTSKWAVCCVIVVRFQKVYFNFRL